jgi:uncharacterized coiled-coil DUF342 family protein
MGNKRNEYVQKLKGKIEEWNSDFDQLENKADEAKAEIRTKFQKEVQDLKTKRKELNEKIGVLRKSGEVAWEDVKVGADIAYQALGEALKSAKSRFK